MARLLRTSLRSLLHAPAFSAIAVVTLAVGLSANAALFSIYDQLVLSSVTAPRAGSLVAIWASNPQLNFNAPAVSWPRYVEIERQTKVFASVAVSAFDNFTLTGHGDQPEQLNGLRISHGFFRTLGIRPVQGREFTPAEDVPNGPTVCILSHELWTSRFGARGSLVGETIQLNGQSWQVVGVMPPQMTAPFRPVQVFAPRVFEVTGLTAQQIENGAGYAQPIGRLAPGATLAQASRELDAIGQGYGEAFAGRLDARNASEARDFADSIVGNLKPTFYTLLGGVSFVLLIACANVSSLFLGRLTSRQKEIAVRQSLGATRAAIVRQCLVESLIFSVAAALLGMLLALWALSAAQSVFGSQLPPNTIFALNWRASAFLALVAVTCAFLVGLVPALQASRTDLVETLNDASRGSSSARGGRLRSSLIVAEVALSVVLLVGSGLLLSSFLTLQRTPPGFEPSGVGAAFVGVPVSRYTTSGQQVDFFSRVVERLKSQPQVSGAAVALGLPVTGFGARSPYSVVGRPILPLPERPLASLQIVSEDYFEVLRIPLRQGRGFAAEDRDGAPGVCVINEGLAARLFPDESPLGRQLARGRDANIVHTIVGVVADVRSNGLTAPPPDEIYYPVRQLGRTNLSVIAKTSGDAALLQSAIRTAVAEVDPDQPISFFQTLDGALAQSLGVQRIVASLTAAFAVVAVILSAVGLYSVVAYTVAQRRHEIGIRMALGARPGQVLGLVMRGGLLLVTLGLVIGLAGAAATTRVIGSLLTHVSAFDPLVYAGVAVGFTAIAALACLLPSLSAARVAPLAALGDRRPPKRG